MKSNILFGLVVLALLVAPVVAAQNTAMIVQISFQPDGNATIDNIEVSLAGIDAPLERSLSDSIKLVVEGTTYYTTSVPVTYQLLDAQGILPKMTVTSRLPYFGNKGILKVIRDDRVVTEFELTQLCNNDGWCRGFENGLSCAADCDIRVPDNVCLPYPDRACDPDCAPKVDPDCAPPTPAGFPLPLYFLTGLIIVAVFYFLYTRRR